jgi:hypothetical protein
VVRSIFLVGFDKEDPDLRRFVHGKHNLSWKGSDLLFRIVPTNVNQEGAPTQYLKVNWTSSDKNVDAASFFDRREPKKGSTSDWLREYLREHGRSLYKDIVEAGEEAGH